MKLLTRITALVSTLTMLISVAVPAAAAKVSEPVELTASTADDWTSLFYRTSQKKRTWIGADGIYSVALDGNDAFASADRSTITYFFFSDTLMGTSDENGNHTGQWGMPSHTAAQLYGSVPDKDDINFIYGHKGNMNPDQHLFNERKWLFDSVVLNETLYVFGFTPSDDMKPLNIDMWSFPVNSKRASLYAYEKTADISELIYRTEDDRYLYAYGMGITSNTVSAGAPDPDGYIYIYGYRDAMKEWSRKDLIVSRIKETDFPDFSKLTYWDGENWVDDILSSSPVLRSVSCEMSVTPVTVGPYKGKYIAVYTNNTSSAEVAYSIGDTPYGPFSDPVVFYNCPEHGQTSADGVGTRSTYNAKAHPHLSKGTKLLVSYNCNVSNCETQHPSDYYPRFLWLDLDPNNQDETVSSEEPQFSSDGSLPKGSVPDSISSVESVPQVIDDNLPVIYIVLAIIAVAFIGGGLAAVFIKRKIERRKTK